MTNRFFLIFLAMSICASSAAQVPKRIKKGRRNKSESRFELSQGEFQVDWEAGREKITDDISTYIYPNIILHYGISNRVEVNLETTLLTVNDQSVSPETTHSGFEPLQIGVNYVINKETDNGPAVIASLQLAIPTLASDYFKAYHLAPTLQVDVQQPFGQKISAGVTPGVFWDGFSTSPYFTYNFTFNYAFAKRWQFTTEFFGFIGPDIPQYNFDVQMAYIFNSHLQTGVTVGSGLSDASHKGYLAVNGTWNFGGKKKKI